MNSRLTFAAALGALLLPLPALAQEEEPDPAVFATYFYCNEAREARADTIISESVAPIMDRHMAAGHLTAWGWYAHNTGGRWRRLLYMVSPDIPTVMSTREAVIDDLISEAAEATAELTAVCPSHDDYVWEVTQGSDPTLEQGRPAVAMSTYWVCDFSEENRADRIVENVFADIYNKHLEAGNITGWSWLEHNIGGKYRRLSVIDAADMSSLLFARDAIIDDLVNEAPIALDRFGAVCNSHSDYIWEVQIAKP